ncbi:MAG: carboxymuconolactone decarboxylase family protein [Hyphomicrobiaceae bacterium]
MARLRYLEKADLAAEDQELLSRDIALYKILAHSPNGARAFQGLGRFIRFKSRLDPRLRELAILQVGYLTRAPYEYSHHIKIGRDFGVSNDDIRAMIDATEGRPAKLDRETAAVLKAAREMTLDLKISDETFAILRETLDEERLTDLVITISFYNGVVRYLATMEIDVEPEYQKYLDEFPLPAGKA